MRARAMVEINVKAVNYSAKYFGAPDEDGNEVDVRAILTEQEARALWSEIGFKLRLIAKDAQE